jgi:hypothetical protein
MMNRPKETTMTYEQETDTRLAEVYGEILRLRNRQAGNREQLMYHAGLRKRYTTRSKYTWTNDGDFVEVSFPDALDRVQAMLAESGDEYFNPLSRGGTIQQVRDNLDKLDQLEIDIAKAEGEYMELEAAYTGWSRFFLVTSSRGHIHSSMGCSTCRPTTTYGWLPGLSGLTETDAVAEHGPALCSVCFPTAPVEMVGGWITAAQAQRRAA